MARSGPPSVMSSMPTAWQRQTRGGRTLEYELRVIQQPERARACGSGAKSSADRRPVDPPPVVELRINDINGVGPEGKEDITFTYEANFFLFATLEVTRPIAQHRGQGQQAQQIPVLTGMPVSGMAYLDRPKMAGYFIFPDLSVRHEGQYRLSFNLYEETKEMADTDKEMSDGSKTAAGSLPDKSFDWRMEVKSEGFTVYSAKKFPGLAESTDLSRTVAEQGCRVRIRRDVRMRRRDSKFKGEYDEVQEEGHRSRAEERYAGERSRSNSADSGDGYAQDPVRRAINNSPIAPNTARPSAGWLGFMGEQDCFAPPKPPPPPAPAMQPVPQSYHQQPQSYPHKGVSGTSMHQAPLQSQQAPPLPPNNHYPQHPQSAHPGYAPRESFESERRQSYPVYASQTPQHRQYHTAPPPERQYAQYQPQPSYAAHRIDAPSQTHLPPMKNISIGLPASNYESLQSQSDRFPLPRINAPPAGLFHGHDRSLEPQTPVQCIPSQPLQELPRQTGTLQELPRHAGKRQFDSAFTHTLKAESLINGMRPSSPHDKGEDDQEALDLKLMHYKRADGSNITRPPPQKLRTYS